MVRVAKEYELVEISERSKANRGEATPNKSDGSSSSKFPKTEDTVEIS